MTKEKLKAIMVLTIAAIILLIIVSAFTGLIIFTFPLFMIPLILLVFWVVEWLIKNIDYKKLAAKTKEHSKKVADKIKIEKGKKIIIDSIDELRKKK